MFLVSEEIEFILDFKLNNVDTIFYCFVFFCLCSAWGTYRNML
jgi:hypothetical protein